VQGVPRPSLSLSRANLVSQPTIASPQWLKRPEPDPWNRPGRIAFDLYEAATRPPVNRLAVTVGATGISITTGLGAFQLLSGSSRRPKLTEQGTQEGRKDCRDNQARKDYFSGLQSPIIPCSQPQRTGDDGSLEDNPHRVPHAVTPLQSVVPGELSWSGCFSVKAERTIARFMFREALGPLRSPRDSPRQTRVAHRREEQIASRYLKAVARGTSSSTHWVSC
jgi:hypothetical protein